MNKICTTLEQSKKLIELGLDSSTSDMTYYWFHDCETDSVFYELELCKGRINDNDIPSWSLSALLSLLPTTIMIPATDGGGYFYKLEWQFGNDNSLSYVAYTGYDRKRECLIDIYHDHDDEPKDDLDIAYSMLCWVIKNKHLKAKYLKKEEIV